MRLSPHPAFLILGRSLGGSLVGIFIGSHSGRCLCNDRSSLDDVVERHGPKDQATTTSEAGVNVLQVRLDNEDERIGTLDGCDDTKLGAGGESHPFAVEVIGDRSEVLAEDVVKGSLASERFTSPSISFWFKCPPSIMIIISRICSNLHTTSYCGDPVSSP